MSAPASFGASGGTGGTGLGALPPLPAVPVLPPLPLLPALPVVPPPTATPPPFAHPPLTLGLQVKPAPHSASLLHGTCQRKAHFLIVVVVHCSSIALGGA